VGTQEKFQSANSPSPRSDASICVSGAMRLRNRPMWRLSLDELRMSSATGQLLEALGRALARDPCSLPASVRRAALSLARECGVSAPPEPIKVDHNSHPEPPSSASGKPAARSRTIPFCASIRLGRMG
jgi:hypothetical protein